LSSDPEIAQPLDTGDGCLRKPGELGLGGVQVARRVAAAVAADRRHELALRPLELAHAGAHGNQPLGDRAHLLESAVSLVRSEGAIGHGAAVS
jgi:hypothetical protein